MKKNEILFSKITETDIPELTSVMKKAFDDDSKKFHGSESGGPEGYDNGDFFRKWLLGYENCYGFKAIKNNKIVGAILVWVLDNDINILGNMFVDPNVQDEGIGYQIWEYVEKKFDNVKIWKLETPKKSLKNHHFYQKCGFIKVSEEDDSFIFKKVRK